MAKLKANNPIIRVNYDSVRSAYNSNEQLRLKNQDKNKVGNGRDKQLSSNRSTDSEKLNMQNHDLKLTKFMLEPESFYDPRQKRDERKNSLDQYNSNKNHIKKQQDSQNQQNVLMKREAKSQENHRQEKSKLLHVVKNQNDKKLILNYHQVEKQQRNNNILDDLKVEFERQELKQLRNFTDRKPQQTDPKQNKFIEEKEYINIGSFINEKHQDIQLQKREIYKNIRNIQNQRGSDERQDTAPLKESNSDKSQQCIVSSDSNKQDKGRTNSDEIDRILIDLDFEDDDLQIMVTDMNKHFGNRFSMIEQSGKKLQQHLTKTKSSKEISRYMNLNSNNKASNHQTPQNFMQSMFSPKMLSKQSNLQNLIAVTAVLSASKGLNPNTRSKLNTNQNTTKNDVSVSSTLQKSHSRKTIVNNMQNAFKMKLNQESSKVQNGNQGSSNKNQQNTISLNDRVRFAEFRNEKDFIRFLDLMVKPMLNQNKAKDDQQVFASKIFTQRGAVQQQQQKNILWKEHQLKLNRNKLILITEKNQEIYSLNLVDILKIETEYLQQSQQMRSNFSSLKNNKNKKYIFKIHLNKPISQCISSFQETQQIEIVPALNNYFTAAIQQISPQNIFNPLSNVQRFYPSNQQNYNDINLLTKRGPQLNQSFNMDLIQPVDDCSDFFTNTIILNNDEDQKSVLSSELTQSINLQHRDEIDESFNPHFTKNLNDNLRQSQVFQSTETFNSNNLQTMRTHGSNLLQNQIAQSLHSQINKNNGQRESRNGMQLKQSIMTASVGLIDLDSMILEYACDDENMCKKWVVLLKWLIKINQL
eukprot:403340614